MEVVVKPGHPSVDSDVSYQLVSSPRRGKAVSRRRSTSTGHNTAFRERTDEDEVYKTVCINIWMMYNISTEKMLWPVPYQSYKPSVN